ncbi:MAG TPA: DUF2062 domain-containing protein [Planctomycetota bacterium]|nr:DUF2062 domain-containing protein [Planctomycetota bacterium]
MLYRSRIRMRRLLRKLVNRDDPPERVARGIAAGFFAAAFPLPGLQILLSVAMAWIARGNKAVAVMPQFLSNPGTMVPLAYLQYWIGVKLWPGRAGDVELAIQALRRAGEAWNWSDPYGSMQQLGSALAGLGMEALGPMAVGVVITGTFMAALAYPVSLILIAYLQARRLRMRALRGIGLRPPRGKLEIADVTLPENGHAGALLRYAVRRETYVQADSVLLLVDGRQAYPEMLRCIENAEHSVDLETYILRADRTGRRFAKALKAAARRGVNVRLAYDGVGGLGVPMDYIEPLLDAGVQVAVYRPLNMLWKLGLGPMNRRNHRKILIIDRKIAFTGGLNIGDEYAARENGGGGWRDTHVRLDGSAPARQLLELLNHTWARSQKFSLHEERPDPHLPAPHLAEGIKEVIKNSQADEAEAASFHPEIPFKPEPTSTDVPVQILSNKEFLQRVRVRHAYMHAIREARHYILIENAYFIPDRGIRRALRNAVKRGVKVGVVVAMYSDVHLAALASRALYGDLLTSGVRLFEYPVAMLHSKAAVIDDVWSVVSSYNLDHRSLKHNLEAGVFLLDTPFARALRNQILADIRRCREVTLQFHESRPWNEALAESIAYQSRYWL